MGWTESDHSLEDEDEEEGDVMQVEDPFTTRLLNFQQEGGSFTPVVATRTVLSSLGPGEVLTSYYITSNVYRDLPVYVSHNPVRE
jgi:hypothetical protein